MVIAHHYRVPSPNGSLTAVDITLTVPGFHRGTRQKPRNDTSNKKKTFTADIFIQESLKLSSFSTPKLNTDLGVGERDMAVIIVNCQTLLSTQTVNLKLHISEFCRYATLLEHGMFL